MTYDPTYEATVTRTWYVGSEHGEGDNTEYRYDTEGWPYFVGINETDIGKSDFHIATGIQCLQHAQDIVNRHNRDSLYTAKPTSRK